MFTYQANESWSTFYFPDFVPPFETTFTNSTLESLAKEKCNNDRLCLFDVAATERIEVGIATMEDVEIINRIEEASVERKKFNRLEVCIIAIESPLSLKLILPFL